MSRRIVDDATARIPPTIRELFAGTRRHSMTAHAAPWCALMPEYWLAYKAAHPQAKPPAGFEWLDTPEAATRYPAAQIALARQMIAEAARLNR